MLPDTSKFEKTILCTVAVTCNSEQVRNGMKCKIQLEERLFPMQAYFNGLHDEYFLPIMKDLANGIGFDFDTTGCLLPEGGEDFPAEGYITFYTPHEEITISNEEFLSFVDMIFSNYIKDHPNHFDEASEVCRMIRDGFATPTSLTEQKSERNQ